MEICTAESEKQDDTIHWVVSGSLGQYHNRYQNNYSDSVKVVEVFLDIS